MNNNENLLILTNNNTTTTNKNNNTKNNKKGLTKEQEKEEKKINFRKEIRACVNCRKNHKKCDGKLPCSFCVRRKIECIENKKRKNVGRPRKTEPETQPNKVQCLEIVKMLTCEKCSTKQKFGSKFCNNCGYRILDQEAKNDELLREMQILQRKNMELINIIQMNMFTSSHMWFMMKLSMTSNRVVVYPMPSFILEFSPSFQNLLGYTNLSDVYYNDLLPKHHLTILDNPSLTIRIEKVEGLKSPKLIYRDSLFIKHAQGHYVHLLVNASLYFDPMTKQPSMRMIYVEKIVNLHVDKESIPLQHNFFTMTFYCEDTNQLPDMIRKIRFVPSDVQDNKFLALPTQLSFPNNNQSQALQIPNNLIIPTEDLFFDNTYDNLFSFY